MSANKFTESLTCENAAAVFVNHQVGLYSGVRDIAVAEPCSETPWVPLTCAISYSVQLPRCFSALATGTLAFET